MAINPSASFLSKKYVGTKTMGKVLVEVYNSPSTDTFGTLSHFFFRDSVAYTAEDLRFSSVTNNPVDTSRYGVKLYFKFTVGASVQYYQSDTYNSVVTPKYINSPINMQGSIRHSVDTRHLSQLTAGSSITPDKTILCIEITYDGTNNDTYKRFSLLVYHSSNWWNIDSYIVRYFNNTDAFLTNTIKYLSLDDISNTVNTNTVISNTIKNLETTGKVLYFVFSSTSTKSFDKLQDLYYRDSANYTWTEIMTQFMDVGSTARTDSFGVKMFFYITIDTAGIYSINAGIAGNTVNIYINGTLVLNKTATTVSSSLTYYVGSIYLNKGTYLVYIEKDHKQCISYPLTRQLSLELKLDGQTYQNIDNFIKNRYTPLTNATTTYTTAVNKLCLPTTDLYKNDSVCADVLKNNNSLNTIVNNDCFNPTFKKGTDGLLHSNCLNIVSNKDAKFNTELQNTLKKSYNSWAKKVVTDKSWSSNYDPLVQYIQTTNPSQTDFSFNDTIKDYCETNLDNEFDAKTQTKNQLCKEMYNRTYTGDQKILADNSIQQVKNNYCDPNKNISNITNSNCVTEYTNKNNLSTPIRNYCFPNGVLKKGSNNLIDSNCSSLYTLNNLNTDIKNNFSTAYNTWGNSTIKNTNTNFTTEHLVLNEYINTQKPDRTSLLGTGAITNLTNFCKTQIGDKFTADVNNDNLCNQLYSSPTYNTDANISKSIDEIKTNYCTAVVDGKPRYETDPLCAPLQTTLLNNTIQQRCIKDGNFQYADKWCKDTSDTNINNTSAPYATMKNARNANLKTNITSTIVKQYENNKFLTDDNYNYAISMYPSVTSKNINDELLNNKLLDYCENIEPNYPTNPNSQCKGIYDTYKDNSTIKDSRDRMRDALCITGNNIMTNNADNNTSNVYHCKSTVFDTRNLTRFSSSVNDYCGKDSNMHLQDCRNYYDSIEQKVADSLNLTSASSFENKTSSFENKEACCDDNSIYIILLFIFILLFVCVISKCYYSRHTNNILNAIVS